MRDKGDLDGHTLGATIGACEGGKLATLGNVTGDNIFACDECTL